MMLKYILKTQKSANDKMKITRYTILKISFFTVDSITNSENASHSLGENICNTYA